MPARRRDTAARMGRPVGSTAAQTRSRIILSGRRVFSAVGYEQATMEMVAAEAGLSRAALGRYFSSKADLYETLLADIDKSVLHNLLDEQPPGDDGTAKRLSWIFRRAGRLNAEDPSLTRFTTTAIVDGFRNPEFATLARAQIDVMRSYFDAAMVKAQRENRLPEGADPTAFADLLLATFWGLGLFGAFMDDSKALEDVMDVLVEHVIPALLPGPR